MASLSEMLQYADYIAKNKQENSIGGQLAGLLQSGLSGYEAGQKIRSNNLDQKIKQIDLQKQQADLEQTAQNTRITKNLGQAMGILPLDDSSVDAARSTALDDATHTTPPADNTNRGRIKSIHTGAGDYDVVPGSIGKSGMTFDFKAAKSDKAPKDPAADNARVRAQAEAAARREKYNNIASLVGPEEAQKFSNVQPTEDEVQKFIPEMDSYLNGNKATAENLRTRRRAADKIVSDHLTDIQSQIADQRARLGVGPNGQSNTTLYSAFHTGDSDQLDKLTTRRDRLIQGGGVDELRSQIKEDIDELKKDPQTNRAAIIDKTKELLRLAQSGRQ